MPLENGGGFAVAVGSHEASWKDEAHFVTGASTTSPPEGFLSARDMIQRRTGSGTCNLVTSAPHLHRRMEETKRVYPVKRGDVIFHERWMFHRTIAFSETFLNQRRQENEVAEDPPIYRRYSLRYGPGSSVIPPGYGTEPSVLWEPSNGGKTADTVCEQSGPWYPQAWPTPSVKELESLHEFVSDKLTLAYQRQTNRKQEMKPYLAKLAREQAKKTSLPKRESRPKKESH